jgi:hypothetical protein
MFKVGKIRYGKELRRALVHNGICRYGRCRTQVLVSGRGGYGIVLWGTVRYPVQDIIYALVHCFVPLSTLWLNIIIQPVPCRCTEISPSPPPPTFYTNRYRYRYGTVQKDPPNLIISYFWYGTGTVWYR